MCDLDRHGATVRPTLVCRSDQRLRIGQHALNGIAVFALTDSTRRSCILPRLRWLFHAPRQDDELAPAHRAHPLRPDVLLRSGAHSPGRDHGSLIVVPARRYLDLSPSSFRVGDMPTPQTHDVGVDGEGLDAEQRRTSPLPLRRTTRSSPDLESRKDSQRHGAELDIGIQPLTECADDSRSEVLGVRTARALQSRQSMSPSERRMRRRELPSACARRSEDRQSSSTCRESPADCIANPVTPDVRAFAINLRRRTSSM